MTLPAVERATGLLQLQPDSPYEVYRVSRIYVVSPGMWGRCIACQDDVKTGDRCREVSTRLKGTDWRVKRNYHVHEACWLQVRSVERLRDFLAWRAAKEGVAVAQAAGALPREATCSHNRLANPGGCPDCNGVD